MLEEGAEWYGALAVAGHQPRIMARSAVLQNTVDLEPLSWINEKGNLFSSILVLKRSAVDIGLESAEMLILMQDSSIMTEEGIFCFIWLAASPLMNRYVLPSMPIPEYISVKSSACCSNLARSSGEPDKPQ